MTGCILLHLGTQLTANDIIFLSDTEQNKFIPNYYSYWDYTVWKRT